MPLTATRRRSLCGAALTLLLMLQLLTMQETLTAEGAPAAAATNGSGTTDVYQQICGICSTDPKNCPDICIKEPNPNIG